MPSYPTKLYDPYTTTLAAALATRQSPPNIVADTGEPTPPTISGTNAYLLGMADAIIGNMVLPGVGFQLASQITLSNANTTSTTYADMPNALTTFTAPVAKTYGILAIVNAYPNVAGQSGWIRISVNNSSFSGEVISHGDVVRTPMVVIHSAACVQGANTLRIQWRTDNTGQQFNIDAVCKAQFFVVG